MEEVEAVDLDDCDALPRDQAATIARALVIILLADKKLRDSVSGKRDRTDGCLSVDEICR